MLGCTIWNIPLWCGSNALCCKLSAAPSKRRRDCPLRFCCGARGKTRGGERNASRERQGKKMRMEARTWVAVMGALRSDHMTTWTHFNEALPSSYEQGIKFPKFSKSLFFSKMVGYYCALLLIHFVLLIEFYQCIKVHRNRWFTNRVLPLLESRVKILLYDAENITD